MARHLPRIVPLVLAAAALFVEQPSGSARAQLADRNNSPTASDRTADKTNAQRFSEYPILYATDRVPQSVVGRRESYGSGRARQISFGSALITVPAAHIIGNLELPPISTLEWRLKLPRRPRNKETQFGIEDVKALSKEEWARLVEQRSGNDTLLVYIPGRGLSFSDSATQAAAMGFDLLQKNVLLYSWPAEKVSYTYDRESVQASEPYLTEVFEFIDKAPIRRINIVAVGMAAGTVMQIIKDHETFASKLDNLVLVAPDIDKDSAEHLISRLRHVRLTVYSDKEDKELRLASSFWGQFRFGAVPPDQINAAGFDFVVVEPRGELYGEGKEAGILRDIQRLLASNQPPEQRGLKKVPVSSPLRAYWTLE